MEVVVGAALIFVLVSAFTTAVTYGEQGVVIAGQRARASLVAEEGLEAVRTMRDYDFTSLVDGTYGIGQALGTWAFSGTSDTEDIFTRSVSISTVDVSTKLVTSTVTWPVSASRTGTITETAYMIDTSQLVPQAKSLQVDVSGGHVSSNNRLVGLKIKNIGGGTIALSTTTVSWTGGAATVLTEIDIHGQTQWSDVGPGYPQVDQPSGGSEGIVPVVMSSKSANPINNFVFDKNIHNSTVTVKFIMADTSSTTVSVGPL